VGGGPREGTEEVAGGRPPSCPRTEAPGALPESREVRMLQGSAACRLPGEADVATLGSVFPEEADGARETLRSAGPVGGVVL
jgi:hypothetical protein